jgi:tetratricopeptide (TPR) repeat protein
MPDTNPKRQRGKPSDIWQPTTESTGWLVGWHYLAKGTTMRWVRAIVVAPWLAGVLAAGAAAEPAKQPVATKAPWQRVLHGEDANKAAKLEEQLDQLRQTGKLADALKAAEALVALREHAQGADHWQAADARGAVETIRRVLRHGEEVGNAFARSFALQRQADPLVAKGRYREAQPLLAEALALRRKVLGEEHPNTVQSYNYVALNLDDQGKYAEAAEGYARALAIRRKVLGEEHPDMAQSYNNVASNLHAQGKYAEAAEGYARALAIHRKVLGEATPTRLQATTTWRPT